MIFAAPDLDLEDTSVLAEIHAMRSDLADLLRTPKRWQGGLRRTMLARAIRGSNSIEGYHVDVDDAVAALDDDEPLSADQRTFAEIRGYRQALGLVLAMVGDTEFRLDASTLRSMHYMMLSHELLMSPGRYRRGPIYVHDESTGSVVYEAPEAASVAGLMDELMASLVRTDDATDPLVTAAMAHLNLVMIHPFRDGNGRMARALQTLVLTHEGMAEPAFSSIEEWLGNNTEDYYRVLALTGAGAWSPERETSTWVKFNLRAHHIQAQTVRRRFAEAAAIWAVLDQIVADKDLPERVTATLYDAAIGFRIRRTSYVKQADIEERTATRDLRRLVDEGLLRAVGATRGRHYLAGAELTSALAPSISERPAIIDPYSWMRSVLASGRADH